MSVESTVSSLLLETVSFLSSSSSNSGNNSDSNSTTNSSMDGQLEGSVSGAGLDNKAAGPRGPIMYRPPDLISAEVANDVAEAVYCYILPVLVVFGTVGNVLSIIVLCVEKKKDSTNSSLTALAVSDTGYILTTFARQTSCIISKFDPTLGRNFTTLMYGQMIVVNICFSRVTSVITAIISTERCLAVTFPLKVREIVTRPRMILALVLAFVVTFGLIGPVFFMGEVYWTTNPRTNTSYVTYQMTEWYLNDKEALDAYRDIFLNAVLRFLPAVLVIFNTVVIITRVKRASSWRGDTASQAGKARSAREKKLTNMLLVLCGVYIFCTLPGIVFQCFTFATDEFSVFGRYRHTYKMTTAISLLTQFINSSINFVIYMAMNERFAKTYVELFGCRFLLRKWLVHNQVISGFQALRQARAPVAGFEPVTERSLQISCRTRYDDDDDDDDEDDELVEDKEEEEEEEEEHMIIMMRRRLIMMMRNPPLYYCPLYLYTVLGCVGGAVAHLVGQLATKSESDGSEKPAQTKPTQTTGISGKPTSTGSSAESAPTVSKPENAVETKP
ncbi:chemosensory receptor a [Plakobranchus ocellatus]|uniref:Chemosensory receptor a n=1 Tax=Plakobranchus ocellatus TaxID=259542 RepID=A0AAV4BN44_9GAST|nr:chemosensory receptor a [Plakobranchus ocellatus]